MEATTPASAEAPPVGTLFTHDGARYRLTGYLRRHVQRSVDRSDPMAAVMAKIAAEAVAELDAEHLAEFGTERRRGHGPDDCQLEFCLPGEAEYVSGYGACGTIVRVGDVVSEGMVDWPEDRLAAEAEGVEERAGQLLW